MNLNPACSLLLSDLQSMKVKLVLDQDSNACTCVLLPQSQKSSRNKDGSLDGPRIHCWVSTHSKIGCI